jgi:hypothetical protein
MTPERVRAEAGPRTWLGDYVLTVARRTAASTALRGLLRIVRSL